MSERRGVRPMWATSLVFTREDGQAIHPDWVTKRFERLVRSSGLPFLTPHGLRHSHVVALHDAGVAAKEISDRVGHSSVAFTQDRYNHVLTRRSREAATAAARVIDGEGETLR